MRTLLPFALIASFASVTATADPPLYKPSSGFVPTKEVAIAIAVAVWGPLFGTDTIASERPYHAVLKNGVWEVTGSMPAGAEMGGVATALISKDDGRVLNVWHGK
jgi:hypothetical protein